MKHDPPAQSDILAGFKACVGKNPNDPGILGWLKALLEGAQEFVSLITLGILLSPRLRTDQEHWILSTSPKGDVTAYESDRHLVRFVKPYAPLVEIAESQSNMAIPLRLSRATLLLPSHGTASFIEPKYRSLVMPSILARHNFSWNEDWVAASATTSGGLGLLLWQPGKREWKVVPSETPVALGCSSAFLVRNRRLEVLALPSLHRISFREPPSVAKTINPLESEYILLAGTPNLVLGVRNHSLFRANSQSGTWRPLGCSIVTPRKGDVTLVMPSFISFCATKAGKDQLWIVTREGILKMFPVESSRGTPTQRILSDGKMIYFIRWNSGDKMVRCWAVSTSHWRLVIYKNIPAPDSPTGITISAHIAYTSVKGSLRAVSLKPILVGNPTQV
jgi:hypothetical protein